MNDYRLKIAISTIVSSIGFIFIIQFGLSIKNISLGVSTEALTDIVLYTIALLFFVISLIVFYLLIPNSDNGTKVLDRECGNIANASIIILLITIAALVGADTLRRTAEMSGYPLDAYWLKIPSIYISASMCFISVLFWMIIWRFKLLQKEANKKYKKAIIYAIYILIIFSMAYIAYNPNLTYNAYTLYHSDAYFNSVYNAYYNEPYSPLNYSTYGHHAIILSFLLKLMSNIAYFPLLMAILTGFTGLFVIYSIDYTVKSPFLKLASSMVVPGLLLRNSFRQIGIISLQGIPHRFVFIALVNAILTFGVKHKVSDKIWLKIVVYLISTIGVIWNFETGMVCVFTCSAFYILKEFNKSTWKSARLYIMTFLHILVIFISFFAAWGATSLWNISKGGKMLSLNLFMVPYVTVDKVSEYTSNFVQGLNINLQSGNSLWLIAAIFMLCFISICLLKTLFSKEKRISERLILYGAIAISGIGALYFYVNRSGFGGLFIIYFHAIILLSALAQFSIDYYQSVSKNTIFKSIAKGISAITISIIFLMSIYISIGRGLQTYDSGVDNRNNNEVRYLEKVLNTISSIVPPDTPALGSGVAFIYSQLGWINPIKVLDYPARGSCQKASDFLEARILSAETPIFVNLDCIRVDLGDKAYLIDELYYKANNDLWIVDFTGSYEFCYLIPKE